MMKVPKPKPLNSWDDLHKTYVSNKNDWDGWLFRGQSYRKESDYQPSLKTSLEMAMDRFGIPLKIAPKVEYQVFRDFKRRCHLVSSYIPPDDNIIEWLALIRHYGGPVRLQDWTYSFWNAVYFALDRAQTERKNEKKYACEIWALNVRWWQGHAERNFTNLKRVLKKYGSNSAKEGKVVLKIKDKPGLWFINPFRMNDRLSAQQGAFVIPLDVTKSFMENLLAVGTRERRDQNLRIYTVQVSADLLRECFKELHRMNISRATLYPGLEGLASNLANAIAIPHLFHNIKGDLASGPF